MESEPIATIKFADGIERPVYDDGEGSQYILDGNGKPVYGVWFIPRDEPDVPIVVGDAEPF